VLEKFVFTGRLDISLLGLSVLVLLKELKKEFCKVNQEQLGEIIGVPRTTYRNSLVKKIT
jgi:hypothetical protein